MAPDWAVVEHEAMTPKF